MTVIADARGGLLLYAACRLGFAPPPNASRFLLQLLGVFIRQRASTMNAGAAVKRLREDDQLISSAAVKRRHRIVSLIGDFVARPAFLHAFQAAVKQLQAVFPSRYTYGRSFEANSLSAMRSRVCTENRLLLVTEGRLCAMLARRLLCFNGECAVRDALRLGTSALSRRHFFRNSSATCVTTLAGHIHSVLSVAFHPTAQLLATSSRDKTVRLWLLSSDNSSATCVATLEGRSNYNDWVYSVAFHPTAQLLATGSHDKTARLWLLSSDNSSATCVATLEGHSGSVNSVAFHPTAQLLATGSGDRTVRLWLLSSYNSSATCVSTLEGHSGSVNSVAFHPTAQLLATGSGDKTARLWLLSSDNSSATCVATLEGHLSSVNSVAFHPTAQLLATGSHDSTVRLWLLSSDNSSATCVATLKGHIECWGLGTGPWGSVNSVAFHPTAQLLATSSQDKTVKLWMLSSDNSSATCVATLEGHIERGTSVAFHPTAPLLATGSWDTTVRLWC
jgi:WD40 repeat protein